MQREQRPLNPLSLIITIAGVILVIAVLFSLTRIVFRILSFLTPFLLIATFIIDRKVIFDYIKMLRGLINRNVWAGIISIILSIACIPFVSAFLFGKAMFKRRAKKVREGMRQQGFTRHQYTRDENVAEHGMTILTPPEQKSRVESTEYDDLFTDIEIDEEGNNQNRP